MLTSFSIAPPVHRTEITIDDILHPALKPHREGFLKVSSLHEIWFAEYGNPDGIPVLYVHGGPGGGTCELDPRFFDPHLFRIIRLDQRACGNSRPHAVTEQNTTQDLIADMEKLREHLGISSWILFGGSWGSCLALAYGEAHSNRVLGFVLRGIFFGTKDEYMRVWHNMGDYYPEVFREYRNLIPDEEQHNLCEAFHRRLLNDDPAVHLPAARAFYKYDAVCATLLDQGILTEMDDDKQVLALSRLFAHYCVNDFFLEDNQIIRDIHRIRHLPAFIVHGRYDLICRPSSAFHLYENWPGSHLCLVPDAGHSLYEVGIAKTMKDAVNKLATLIDK